MLPSNLMEEIATDEMQKKRAHAERSGAEKKVLLISIGFSAPLRLCVSPLFNPLIVRRVEWNGRISHAESGSAEKKILLIFLCAFCASA